MAAPTSTAATANGSIGRSSSSPQFQSPSSSNPLPIAPAPVPQPMMQPSPLMPYPQSSGPVHMTPQAAQSQIVCTGCRTLLVYPNNASNVRCALCSTITPVPPAGTEMAQLVCGGCRTLLMYVRGATSVQCSCCHTVNLSMESSQVAHVNCGGCGMTLMYAYGAQSVKCAVCQFVTQVGSSLRPLPVQQRQYAPPPTQPAQVAPAQSTTSSRTVVVENPMTMDDTGKLVSNVAVGISSDKKS